MRCIVGYLTNLRPHPTRADLRLAEIDGHQVVVGNHYEEGNLGFHVPAGAILPREILEDMWLWNPELGKGRLAGKQGNRVKAREMDGIVSDGLFYGAYYFPEALRDGLPVQTRAWNLNWNLGADVSESLGITFAE